MKSFDCFAGILYCNLYCGEKITAPVMSTVMSNLLDKLKVFILRQVPVHRVEAIYIL